MDQATQAVIETAVGGAYLIPDGREFWIDGPVAREITRRVSEALSGAPIILAERERCISRLLELVPMTAPDLTTDYLREELAK